MSNRNRYEWLETEGDTAELERLGAEGWEVFCPRGHSLLLRRTFKKCAVESAPMTLYQEDGRLQLADNNDLQEDVEYDYIPPGMVFCVRTTLYIREIEEPLPFPCPHCSGPPEGEEDEDGE